ncbi:hypothetical protein [uncultured Selenomonas sp.]|nr:hypothetical protein [uncultured Selenomonas sp.]
MKHEVCRIGVDFVRFANDKRTKKMHQRKKGVFFIEAIFLEKFVA